MSERRLLQNIEHSKCGLIAKIIIGFWLVLVYDLLEYRRTIDVIITKVLRVCLTRVEGFQNLDNILRDWAKDKVQKSLIKALIGTRSIK